MNKIRRPAVLVSIALVSLLAGVAGFQLNAGNDVVQPAPTYMDVPF